MPCIQRDLKIWYPFLFLFVFIILVFSSSSFLYKHWQKTIIKLNFFQKRAEQDLFVTVFFLGIHVGL